MPESSDSRLPVLLTLLPDLPGPVSDMLERWVPRWIDWAGPLDIQSPRDIAGLIDHTILRPTATADDIARLCREAAQWRFKSVCVNPCRVPQAASLLQGSGVLVCTVVGFPLGATTTAAKVAETVQAVRAGATEIDMVVNQGDTLAADWASVSADISAVVDAAAGCTVKVIIETCNLDRTAKIGACVAAALCGAQFVKTSTGFGSGGATPEDIALMRLVVGGGMSVKASGGIRTTADAMSMISAGADRIGASASISIIGA